MSRGASSLGVNEASAVLLFPRHGKLAETLAAALLLQGADGIPVADGTQVALHRYRIKPRNPHNQRTYLPPDLGTPLHPRTIGIKLIPFPPEIKIQKAMRIGGDQAQIRPVGGEAP